MFESEIYLREEEEEVQPVKGERRRRRRFAIFFLSIQLNHLLLLSPLLLFTTRAIGQLHEMLQCMFSEQVIAGHANQWVVVVVCSAQKRVKDHLNISPPIRAVNCYLREQRTTKRSKVRVKKRQFVYSIKKKEIIKFESAPKEWFIRAATQVISFKSKSSSSSATSHIPRYQSESKRRFIALQTIICTSFSTHLQHLQEPFSILCVCLLIQFLHFLWSSDYEITLSVCSSSSFQTESSLPFPPIALHNIRSIVGVDHQEELLDWRVEAEDL